MPSVVLDPTKETVLSGWRDNTARLLVAGKAKDGLFVHATIGTGKSWSVSHVATGKLIAAFKIEFNAYAFAEHILALTDWDAVLDTDALPEGLADEVRAIGAMFEDCHLNYA